MYFYSKKSRRNIVHTGKCFHILRTGIDDIGSFETLNDAYASGYRLCKHCNPMKKQYRKECEDVLKMSANQGLSVYSGNRYITITSVDSKWRITLDGDSNLILYHKNKFETPGNESQVLGYHLQRDVTENSIVSYLDYIIKHDYFRMVHPVKKPKKKKEVHPPRKGTRRYKSAQRRDEKNRRKEAIKNVLDLIDSLKAPAMLSGARA